MALSQRVVDFNISFEHIKDYIMCGNAHIVGSFTVINRVLHSPADHRGPCELTFESEIR